MSIGLLGWRVGVWLSDPQTCEGSEETPPTRRIAPPLVAGEGESLGYGAETKRPLGAYR
jgi:hypothetical protein